MDTDLIDVVTQLREALVKLQESRPDDGLEFEIQRAEVELNFVVEAKDSGGGKVRIFFLDASASVDRLDKSVQTLKLQLEPVKVTSPVTSMPDLQSTPPPSNSALPTTRMR